MLFHLKFKIKISFMKKFLSFFLFLLLFLPISKAQIELQPGEARFTLASLFLLPPGAPGVEEGIQPGQPVSWYESNYLTLWGDFNYLNIKWKAYWSDNDTERLIGVKCYLNCPFTENVMENCENYQSCQPVIGWKPGSHYCSILHPNYLLENINQPENVKCIFFLWEDPSIQFTPYISVNFSVSNLTIEARDLELTVGRKTKWSFNLKSRGLFLDNLNVTITTPFANSLLVGNPTAFLSNVKYGDLEKISSDLILLIASGVKVPVKIMVESEVVNKIRKINGDCSYLVRDYTEKDDKCLIVKTINIKGKYLSLDGIKSSQLTVGTLLSIFIFLISSLI